MAALASLVSDMQRRMAALEAGSSAPASSRLSFQAAAICHLLEGDISAAALLATGLLEPMDMEDL
jgi:hypothetical protein